MQVALIASLQGMQRAGERLANAAAAIAAPAPASPRAADPSPAPPRGDAGLTAAQASGDLEHALAEILLARRAYEANARALARNAETERALLTRGA
jgi:hypothetical protein